MEPADTELLRRVQVGDIEAFTPLVRRHLPLVRAFVALRLPVPNLADEITHETFVFAFVHIKQCDPPTGIFAPGCGRSHGTWCAPSCNALPASRPIFPALNRRNWPV
jgi:hypothetical protein